jgi:hypothetical protein
MNVTALVGAAAALLLAAWFDTSVVVDAQRQAASTFEPGGLAVVMSVGAVAAGGACLLVGWLGVRSSAVVGLLYVVVGGFFALGSWLLWTFAASINGAPPVLPDPVAQAMSDIYLRTQGPLNAVAIIGGAMAVAGAFAIARSVRRRIKPVPSTSAVPAPDGA